jgi:hypothetical protein
MHFDLEDARVVDISAQKLRRLPTDGVPPMPWPEFKRRQLLRRERASAEQRRQFALVAGVALVMIGAFVSWRYLSPAINSAAVDVVALTPPRAAMTPGWDEAAARSVVSERWLAAQPAEPVIVRVGTRAAVTGLEDRIAWVDDTLTTMRAQGGQLERVHVLQHERDQLVNSLAQVRYAETLVSDVP